MSSGKLADQADILAGQGSVKCRPQSPGVYSENTNCAIHFLLLRVFLHTGEPPRPVRHHYLEPGPLSRFTRFADGDPGNI